MKLETRYEFSQAQTLISMARSGLGAAILPRVALPEGDDGLTYRLRIVSPSLSGRSASSRLADRRSRPRPFASSS